MFYKIQASHTYDTKLSRYVDCISKYCRSSEFQYLTNEPRCWEVSLHENFQFWDYYCIDNVVPLFSDWLWCKIMEFGNTDGLYIIPVTISYSGEKRQYYVAIPPRIYCIDRLNTTLHCDNGIWYADNIVISQKNVGRYNLFKIAGIDDDNIYCSETLAKMLLGISQNYNIVKI